MITSTMRRLKHPCQTYVTFMRLNMYHKSPTVNNKRLTKCHTCAIYHNLPCNSEISIINEES